MDREEDVVGLDGYDASLVAIKVLVLEVRKVRKLSSRRMKEALT